MCDPSCDCDVRVTGASTVAYLMEADPSLQRLALICEQFPKKLEQYFRRPQAANPKDVEAMKKVCGQHSFLKVIESAMSDLMVKLRFCTAAEVLRKSNITRSTFLIPDFANYFKNGFDHG